MPFVKCKSKAGVKVSKELSLLNCSSVGYLFLIIGIVLPNSQIPLEGDYVRVIVCSLWNAFRPLLVSRL